MAVAVVDAGNQTSGVVGCEREERKRMRGEATGGPLCNFFIYVMIMLTGMLVTVKQAYTKNQGGVDSRAKYPVLIVERVSYRFCS